MGRLVARRDLAGGARHRRGGRSGSRRWERLAQETAVRGRPRGGALGPEGRAWLLRCTAEAGRAAGAVDVPLWESVVEAFDYGYPYEVARARYRLAEALVESGQRERAAAELRASLETADRLGTAPFREAVVALARRARLDIGVRAELSTVLTGRELEVLRRKVEESLAPGLLAGLTGADVTVCLGSSACIMTGVGDHLLPPFQFLEVTQRLKNPGTQLTATHGGDGPIKNGKQAGIPGAARSNQFQVRLGRGIDHDILGRGIAF